MGTNTENGIRIYGITIRIYRNIRFWEIIPVGSGDRFSVRAQDMNNLRYGKFGLGFL